MIRVNPHYAKIQANYLFAEVARNRRDIDLPVLQAVDEPLGADAGDGKADDVVVRFSVL